MTAISSSSPRAARVASRSVVLPAPGDDTRLIAATPWAARVDLTSAAISSLRAITRSRTSIVRTAIVDLQIRHAQHVASAGQDVRLGSGERRSGEHGLEAELEARRLDARALADVDGNGHELRRGSAELFFGDAGDLHRDTHLVHGAATRGSQRCPHCVRRAMTRATTSSKASIAP